MTNPVSLSVCVPSYNEEQGLESAVRDLFDTVGPVVSQLEIIIVNDASTDKTAHIADRLAEEFNDTVRVIHHRTNRGIGGAFRSALACAKMEYFTHFPGDHENSAEEIAAVIKLAGPDRVITCHHRGTDPRPWPRRCISSLYVKIFNLISGMALNYYNGLSVFPTTTLASVQLRAEGFMLNAETLIKARNYGLEIIENASAVPLLGRQQGKSTALGLRSMCSMVKDFARVFIFKGKAAQ